MPTITAQELGGIFAHIAKWIANLARARDKRRQASREALQRVILAIRETSAYARQLRETSKKDHHIESHLAVLWTELSFSLRQLGLKSLAHRCQIKGRYWADSDQFDEEFLRLANIKLDDLEREASTLMNGI